MKVTDLKVPAEMYCDIVDVLPSLYPPLGARYCNAMRTPTTATTIQNQGPRKMRFTSMCRGGAPPSYQTTTQGLRRYTAGGCRRKTPEVTKRLRSGVDRG